MPKGSRRTSEAVVAQKSGATQLVAVVDDDASVRRSTCRLVQSFGFASQAFGSAEEFLDSGRAPETACLILDMRMPGMDGLALQRELAARALRIPVIFLTARASEEEEARARHAGALDFLRKPVGKHTLLRAIRTAIDESIGVSPGGGREDDDGGV
ncbi:response regulator [Candidatus Binatia bacterium]|nr:response regulator [Candidatus Binatia bacterium]